MVQRRDAQGLGDWGTGGDIGGVIAVLSSLRYTLDQLRLPPVPLVVSVSTFTPLPQEGRGDR